MSENDGRRWFRFRLRTMFVVVTLLCCWLGWEASIVQQRKQVLTDLQENKAFQFWRVDSTPQVPPPGSRGPHVASIPLVRVWLGDVAIQRIQYISQDQGFSRSELARLAHVFPEADLVETQFEPCHPGCFPSGTMIDTPQGPRPIEDLQVSGLVTAVHSNGEVATAHIQSISETNNRLWMVHTDQGPLLTTETQPLCLKVDAARRAGELKPADTILQYRKGIILPVVVREVAPTDRTEKVFNLILDNADVFVAGGFLARSKPPAQLASH